LREVNRHELEALHRALERLARVRALDAPDFLVVDVLEFARSLLARLDDRSEPSRPRDPQLDTIACHDGTEVPDLAQFAYEVALLAAGAFPCNLGLGARLTAQLAPELREQLGTLRQMDEYWTIHGQRYFDDDLRPMTLVPDRRVWLAEATELDQPALVLPAGPARSCARWREAVGERLPVGDYGGPMTVGRTPRAAHSPWWPRALEADECIVSFVLARTGESPPFLPEPCKLGVA
jgi:hypothetical protein